MCFKMKNVESNILEIIIYLEKHIILHMMYNIINHVQYTGGV